MDELEFIKEVMRLFCDDGEWGGNSDLYWRVKGDKIEFMVNCNDLFYWACADVEPLTESDLPLLKSCKDDLEKCQDSFIAVCYTGSLYCSRKRGMRPQQPFYKQVKMPDVEALFNAAGPERDPKDEG